MKALILILLVLMTVLMVSGWILVFVNRKRGKKSRLGYLLAAIGNILMVVFFIIIQQLR